MRFLFNYLPMLLIGTYTFFRSFGLLRFYRVPKGWLRYAAAAFLAVFAAYCCRNLWLTSALLVLHGAMLLTLTDLLAIPIRRIFRARKDAKAYRVCRILYRSGAAALIAVCLILTYGMWNMQHITRAHYTVPSEKVTQSYRIALLADTHYGTVQDKQLLLDHLQIINDCKPDVVILDGDLVDESTSKDDMQELFARIGSELKATYGIFYVYGNHDRQPYTIAKSFTEAELRAAITENGITILQDETVELGDELLLIGRADARWGGSSPRASAAQLLQEADTDRLVLLADHQPLELTKNADAGVDLMLSGHTHAGQIFPVGLFTSLSGGYNYGEFHERNCTLIVSSGFTGWGYPIRTQGHCEYVLVDILPA